MKLRIGIVLKNVKKKLKHEDFIGWFDDENQAILLVWSDENE